MAKIKSWKLTKFRFENLSRSKKVQSTSIIKKPNILTYNTKVVFIKFR